MNQNPRMGVLLRQYKAGEELKAALLPRFQMLGLKRFRREWPPSRLVGRLDEQSHNALARLDEWTRLLERREAEIWKWRGSMMAAYRKKDRRPS